ncbi:superoxide dismutase [Candidatus Peregrinibacteria bacterium]|nr:superoxide dismutase [Candidatus Peregrinibacteria bacterium]
MGLYKLPDLTYSYEALEPHISKEQLQIHHSKHHQAYVDKANAALEKIANARNENADLDMKSILKSLSFNVGGHVLHSLFWENMAPDGKTEPDGQIADKIKQSFGNYDRFKKEFSESALTVEGSGWSALAIDQISGEPLIMQIEKHNVNLYPNARIILALDMWEHAYYIDRKNNKAEFVEAFWKLVDWTAAEKRLA